MENNWASLPEEILGVILNKLAISDQFSFHFVCRPWYSAACEAADLNFLHPTPSSPWLIIPPQSISVPDLYREGKATIDSNDYFYYDLVNKKACKNNKIVWKPPPLEEARCVGSCYDWLAFMDRKSVIYLQNPFRESSSSIIGLPPIVTLPCMESSTILPGGDIEYQYRYAYSGESDAVLAKDLYSFFVHKLVLSSSPSEKKECIVMMIYGEENRLAVCRLGDLSWTPLSGNLKCNYNLYYSASKKIFHVLCDHYENSFELWDFGNFSLPKSTCFRNLPQMPMTPPSLSNDEQRLRNLCEVHKYLAELNGKLLLVVRHIAGEVDKDGQIINNEDDNDEVSYKTICFDAYEFDWSKQRWVLVHCLGSNGEDDVLFLGINNPMIFSSRNFPGMQSNSIYFADDYEYYFYYMTSGRNYGGHDLGIFSFDNNNIDYCYYSGDLMKIIPTPVWICPPP